MLGLAHFSQRLPVSYNRRVMHCSVLPRNFSTCKNQVQPKNPEIYYKRGLALLSRLTTSQEEDVLSEVGNSLFMFTTKALVHLERSLEMMVVLTAEQLEADWVQDCFSSTINLLIQKG